SPHQQQKTAIFQQLSRSYPILIIRIMILMSLLPNSDMPIYEDNLRARQLIKSLKTVCIHDINNKRAIILKRQKKKMTDIHHTCLIRLIHGIYISRNMERCYSTDHPLHVMSSQTSEITYRLNRRYR